MAGYIGSKAVSLSTTSADVTGDAEIDGDLTVGADADISGTLTSDGLTVVNGASDTTATIGSSGTTTLSIFSQGRVNATTLSEGASGAELMVGSSNPLTIGTASTDRINIANNGDISFYEDTGTTAKFFWDASAESLSIGSPSDDNVTIYSTDDVPRLEFEQGGTVYADIGHRGASAAARQNIFEITTKQSEPMAFRTNNTERMRIDSSGNVGIGTDDPSGKLTVEHGDFARLDLNLANATGTTIADVRGLVEGTEKWRLGKTSSSSDDFAINVTGSERMRIDSSGNVGIGVTPSVKFHVKDTFSALSFEHSGGNAVLKIDGGNGDLSGTDFSSLVDTGGTLLFGTNGGSEAMRIDSSGNLLVGVTTNSSSVAGVTAGNSGLITAARSSNYSGIFNRITSDGDIVQFRKDGTTVGSIGSYSGSFLKIQSAGNQSGTLYGTTAHYPLKNGALSDAAIDLGEGSNRFKDLYLSGGVYLGGTGSANKLDDYEEGTFTPTISNATMGTNNAGSYVKIGQMCFIHITAEWSSISSGTPSSINDLPFIGNGNGASYTADSIPFLEVGGVTPNGSNDLAYGRVGDNLDYVQALQVDLSAGVHTGVPPTFDTSGGVVRISFCYQVD